MADDNIYRLEKTITLKQLKPNEYRLWAIQTEATFEVHKCLDIVLDNEPNPTPVDDNGTPIGPIGHYFQTAISYWETRHALAREALLRSLEPTDLLKVIPYHGSAPAIWAHLKNEYGRALDFEYIRVNNQYTSLRKDPNTTMDAHITRFNQLLQEIEYNKPITIPSLQFMLSIGEGWETFSLAKGDWIRQVSTTELHSKIRAMDARKPKPTTPQSPFPSTSDLAKALAFYYDSGFNEQGGCRRYNNNWHDDDDNKGDGPRHGPNYTAGNNEGRKRKRDSDYDPNKWCLRCTIIGHDLHNCRAFAREEAEKMGKSNSNESRLLDMYS